MEYMYNVWKRSFCLFFLQLSKYTVAFLFILLATSAFNSCTEDVILGDGTATTSTTTTDPNSTTTTTAVHSSTTTSISTTSTTTTLLVSLTTTSTTITTTTTTIPNNSTRLKNSVDSDTDKDLLSDRDEENYLTDPNDPDSDKDGYIDGFEILRESDPMSFTSIPEGENSTKNLNHVDKHKTIRFEHKSNSSMFSWLEGSLKEFDSDEDGLSDAREAEFGTDPFLADSDVDGLDDKEELFYWKTDPLNPDSDMDGVIDSRIR